MFELNTNESDIRSSQLWDAAEHSEVWDRENVPGVRIVEYDALPGLLERRCPVEATAYSRILGELFHW